MPQRKRIEEELARSDRGELGAAKRLRRAEKELQEGQLFEEIRSDAEARVAEARKKLKEDERQLESNIAAWRRRLELFDRDLAEEPQRIRRFYEVQARRVEPVGLVYLWPETN